MSITAGDIEDMIKEGLPGAEVRVEDLRGDGEHFAAYIVSSSFAGKNRVQQHQMVYKTLEGKLGEELHALAIQTGVPE
jgi:stress-induced morphogen